MKCINNMDKNIFRGYDIRGVYGENLNEDVAYTIGRSYATILKTRYHQTKCIVGEDNRFSSSELSNALIKGINDSGVDVIYLGLVTSPMLYYANEITNIRAGIIVTASHNPKEYNGFKIAYDILGEICGEEIDEFRDFTLALNFIQGSGKTENMKIQDSYVEMLVKKFSFEKPMRIVVDCGNGTASIVAKDIFEKFSNLQVEYIFCASDPSFPNHHPDPAESENMETLCQRVIQLKADVGIAFDGDCDRVGIVDDEGKILASDFYMAIMAKTILPTVSNKNIMFDVSCSKTLSDEIKKAGGIPYVYKTGNSYIKRGMLEHGMLFGGEISGHTFFKDKFYGFDDGVYAGLRMIEVVEKYGKLSTLEKELVKYHSTPVIKIACPDDKKAFIVEKVKEYCKQRGYVTNTVDGARPEFEDSFAIIRFSNTTPKLTIRFEATTEKRLEELKQEFMTLVQEYIKQYC